MSFLNDLNETNEAIKSPWFGVLYGPPGCGKSELAKYAPRPFFIAIEKGVEKIQNVGKFIDSEGKLKIPATFDEAVEALMYKLKNPGDYKTIVLDSGGFLDKLIVNDIILKHPTYTVKGEDGKPKHIEVESISDYTFGDGFSKAERYWERIVNAANVFIKKEINFLVIAHSVNKNAVSPDGEDYRKIKLDLLEWSNYSVPNLLYKSCDWMYFMRSEIQTVKRKGAFGGSKTVAINSESKHPEIIVYTRSGNAFDAKARAININNIPNHYDIDIGDPETCKVIFNDLDK